MIAAGSGPTTVTLSIQTSNPQGSLQERSIPFGPLAPITLGLLLPLVRTNPARRRLRQTRFPIAAFVLLGVMATLAGCGSFAGPAFPTSKSYTVVVTATDATTGERASTNVTLTVR
jgi:hypothetical protein